MTLANDTLGLLVGEETVVGSVLEGLDLALASPVGAEVDVGPWDTITAPVSSSSSIVTFWLKSV